MRKILGLLVAAAFVAVAASSAMAVQFTAEIVLTVNTSSFSVGLFSMAGTAPAVNDSSTTKVTWIGTSFGMNGGPAMTQANAVSEFIQGASSNTWVNSKVYAKLYSNGMKDGSIVKVYTDNTTGGATYKYGTGITAANAKAMADNGTTNPGLPIAYVLDTANGMIDTNNDQIPDAAVNLTTLAVTPDVWNGFVVADKIANNYSDMYATILSKDGFRYSATYAAGTQTGNNFGWTSGGPAYMYFSTIMAGAQIGHAYGTDTLTFEQVGQ